MRFTKALAAGGVLWLVTGAQAQNAPLTVDIVRDGFGVPHIFTAASDTVDAEHADLAGAYANGFASAADRLFQLEIFRRAGKGRLSEILGEPLLTMDKVIRRDLFTEAERIAQFEALAPADQRAIEAYRDGVNAYITSALADPAERLPVEYAALGFLPEPWEVTDTVAVADFLIGVFGAFGGEEIANAKTFLDLRDKLGAATAEKIFNDLVPLFDDDSFATIGGKGAIPAGSCGDATSIGQHGDFYCDPIRFSLTAFAPTQVNALVLRQAAVSDAAAAGAAEIDAVTAGFRLLGLPPPGSASNAMVISPAHSSTGNPLLLGGPQVGYAVPGFFWEVGLHTPSYDAEGVLPPAGPGIVIGRTSQLAYTITSGISDQVDTYLETLCLLPDGNKGYKKGDGTCAPFDRRIETYLVKPAPTSLTGLVQQNPPGVNPGVASTRVATQEVLRTHHKPATDLRQRQDIDCPVFFIDETADVAFSRCSAHRGQELRSAVAWLNIGRIQPQATGLAALAAYKARVDQVDMSFNYHVATTDGHIAYFHAGIQPLRPGGTDPRLPLVAEANQEWTGFLAKGQMPQVIDPASGFIANWNNRPIRGWSSGDQARLWGERDRIEGLVDQLTAAFTGVPERKLTRDDLGAIMHNAAKKDVFVSHMLPELTTGLELTDPLRASAVNLVQQWLGSDNVGDATFTGNGGAPLQGLDPDTTAVLSNVDQNGKYGLPGIAIYREWRRQLENKIFADELGPRTVNYTQVLNGVNSDDHGSLRGPDALLFHALAHTNATSDPTLAGYASQATNYCDDLGTAALEDCPTTVGVALDAAIAALTTRFDTANMNLWLDPASVTKLPTQGAGPFFFIDRVNRGSYNELFELCGSGCGPVGSAGGISDAGMVAGNVFPPGNSGLVTAPGLVLTIPLAAPATCLSNPNPHLCDQLKNYAQFRYKPMLFSKPAVDGAPGTGTERIPVISAAVLGGTASPLSPSPPDPAPAKKAATGAATPGDSLSLFGEASTK